MTARMKNLNISPMISSAAFVQPLPDVVLSSNMEPQYCQEAGDLQRLRELERRSVLSIRKLSCCNPVIWGFFLRNRTPTCSVLQFWDFQKPFSCFDTFLF